ARDMPFMLIDYDFFETYAVELLAGRTFSTDFPNDRIELPGRDSRRSGASFILNASAVRDFGWTPEEAIGKDFEVFATAGLSLSGRIVGVVAVSNLESLRFSVKPLVFMLSPPGLWQNAFPALGAASVRISGSDVADTLARIDRAW